MLATIVYQYYMYLVGNITQCCMRAYQPQTSAATSSACRSERATGSPIGKCGKCGKSGEHRLSIKRELTYLYSGTACLSPEHVLV